MFGNKFIFILFLFLAVACTKSEDSTNEQEPSQIAPFEGTPLPLIKINTQGNPIVDEPKTRATLQIVQEDELLESHRIGIEIRGSSSQMFEKKSYGLETWDENDEDVDVELGGFPEEEDWILYGPYSDKTLIRNVLIYQLSNQMGQYATKTAFYELEINGSFKGTYVLMEKIKRDKNRVDISKNKAEDISGGYILKIDKPTGDAEWYNETIAFGSQYSTRGELESFRNISFLYEYPKSDDITVEQKEYIQNYIHGFETALVSEEFTSAENGYRNYIDMDSFIDFFILNEISKNPDGFRLSTYIHKDKGEKLKMGPIWDFNIAFGNVDYCNGDTTSGWAHQFNSVCPGDIWQVPFWWGRLLEDPGFVIALQTRWNNLRSSTLASQSLMNDIEGFQEILKSSSASDKNFAKWLILGKYIWPNAFVGDSYISEINYLKDWITNRMEWLDININNL